MKKKKENIKENDIIRIEDTNELNKIIQEKLDDTKISNEEPKLNIPIEGKVNKESKKIEKIKKNEKFDKEVEKIKEVNKDIKETSKELYKVNKTKNKNEKSKLNIFFLIIALFAVIAYGVNIYLKLDFNNLVLPEILKSASFLLISLLIIIILFKVNNKKITPYIFLLTVILIMYTTLSFSYAKDENVYVKDFINHKASEVLEWAKSNNIEIIEYHEYSDTVLKNHIIMQEYGINTLVSEIESLKITISDGPNYDKEIIVSNLTGLTYDEVMTYIKDNHLNNVIIEFIESDKVKDTVIEQIGSGSLKRNDEIKFIFSKGLESESVVVKNLKGLSLFEATSYLKRNSILYELKYEYNNEIPKDYVINQDIVDEIVPDKLILTISKGKEISVPNLSSMTNLEISKWALENNIKIKYHEEYSKEFELGKVIRSDKTIGDIVSENDLITITISKGSMTMPKITSLTDFKMWANNNNVNYEEIYEFSNEFANGEIIKVSHEENTKLTENDTIVITISKGKSVSIPNFVGLSKTNIENKCKELNLSCTFTYGSYTESTKRDIALKQSKANGSVVASGTNVLITLSSGIYEKVTVPSFVGKTKNQIINSCNSLGIKCNFNYNKTYSNEAYDIALNQDKTGSVIKGSLVNITLSIGPAKTYTVIIDGSLLSLGNPEQTKKTLKTKLETACPGVTFNFSFKAVNSGIGYLNPNSQVKVGSNTFTQGKTYNVIINSN